MEQYEQLKLFTEQYVALEIAYCEHIIRKIGEHATMVQTTFGVAEHDPFIDGLRGQPPTELEQ